MDLLATASVDHADENVEICGHTLPVLIVAVSEPSEKIIDPAFYDLISLD